MLQEKLIIKNPMGLYVGPAGTLCTEAARFKSSVRFSLDGTEYNAKSILSVLGACVRFESEITLICEGEDEKEAMAVLSELIRTGLGEL